MNERITPYNITELKENEIFVFGSNSCGVHNGNAASTAMKFGAIMGQAVGAARANLCNAFQGYGEFQEIR